MKEGGSKGSRHHSGSGMGAYRPQSRPWENSTNLIGAETVKPTAPFKIEPQKTGTQRSTTTSNSEVHRGIKYLGGVRFSNN